MGGRQPVEQFCGLLGGVAAQAGEDVHVGVVVDLGGGVCGQHECGQSYRGWCGARQEQGHRPQSPVGSAAACPATGSLVQDGRIQHPVPLGNTILGLACSFSPQGGGLHSAWDDLSMP
ncbi:hypothetical protein ABT124_49805, partial [Streptomyces sp. NPDC001982]|uniref:hypothetical protein n=1 Tax=Streptomyces sp. NPDC001982 TaxID=3154405 RepID=UPI00332F19C1